ncbi:MAG: peroxiredoxin family protein [Pedosphaera sp.]|nr:peroxiredoxin family protein [Pedosphaera sp.]
MNLLTSRHLIAFVALSCFVGLCLPGNADDAPVGKIGSTNEPPAGHSLHGEAFNEGPRQRAVLMPGTGKVNLTITSAHPQAQAFFNQGIGQLHGFWFFEAERSFRQVAAFDTNNAMACWGMAMANVNNTNRAIGFIERAHALKTNASPREILWIEAYHAYIAGKTNDSERRKELIKALEKIIHEHPEELEAKTFLSFQIWNNEGEGISIGSRQAVDALMNEVLAVEPQHPIHHARIHLWNYNKDERALNSAARCGQSAPGIAHMWHMPGHTYSKLNRFDDAAWQQEAATRTDHAYMMEARILPDQIHNYAHNNEWLCRDLLHVGRLRDAIDLAKNMVELPRHPKYNTLNRKEDNTSYDKNHGSSMLGRNRLVDAFLDYELWSDLLTLADTFYLEPTDLPEEQARRLYALALAYFSTGDTNSALPLMSSLDGCWKQLKQERFDATEKAEEVAKKEKADAPKAMIKAMEGFNSRLETVGKYRVELKIWSTIASGEDEDARKLLGDAKDLPKPQRARLWSRLGNVTNTVSVVKELMKDGTNQAPSLALASNLFWKSGETNESTNAFYQLRAISARFDLATPVLARLTPIAEHLGLPADWRVADSPRTDVGDRLPLDSLGPFHWQPYTAPTWTLTDADHKQRSLRDHQGRPVLVVFYLGFGCTHCIEQLNLLGPIAKDFQAQGISIVAVSTDSPDGLHKTVEKAKQEGGFPFPIVSDKSLDTFKAYRAYDDFEDMPLHGTFLIDGEGKVRWQDIGFEPFRDLKFLLSESRRLLGLAKKHVAGR